MPQVDYIGNALGGINAGPLDYGFDEDALTGLGVRQARAEDQSGRLAQFAAGRGLSGAQQSQFFLQGQSGLANALLGAALRARVQRANAVRQEGQFRKGLNLQGAVQQSNLQEQRNARRAALIQGLAGGAVTLGLGLPGVLGAAQVQKGTIGLASDRAGVDLVRSLLENPGALDNLTPEQRQAFGSRLGPLLEGLMSRLTGFSNQSQR